MNQIISDISEVTPTWLTDALTRNGYLKAGSVVSVEVTKTGEAGTAYHAYLMVYYSGNAIVTASHRLFIKYTKPHRSDTPWLKRLPKMNRNEVAFYKAISDTTDLPVIAYDEMQIRDDKGRGRLPVIPCYEAQFCEDTGRAHVLLADLSSTHMGWSDIKQPTPIEYLKSTVGCLARLHAAWWEHPQLGKDIGELPPTPTRDQSSDRRRRLHEVTEERFSAERYAVYEQIVLDETWSKLVDNLQPRDRLTLTHGDIIGNILYPRNLERDEAVFIDWQFSSVGHGTDDLAFFLILSMAPSHSHRVEPTLLTHYYDQLRWHGVSDYGWEEFREDYRRAVVRFLTFALFYWEAGWTTLDRGFAKFEHLACAELL